MFIDSTHTFILKPGPGSSSRFVLQPFFHNHGTNKLEPLSASSRSTPRLLKKPFGEVTEIVVMDNDIYQIVNISGERIELDYKKLSPLLEPGESMLKDTLLKVYDKGFKPVINALQSLLTKFKSNDGKVIASSGENATNVSTDDDDPLAIKPGLHMSQDSGVGLSQLSDHAITDVDVEKSPRCSTSDTEYITPLKRSRISSNDSNVSDCESSEDLECSLNKISNHSTNDIRLRIEEIIEKAKFRSVDPDQCEVPDTVTINRNQVDTLKDALRIRPDKTQCVLGVVTVNNDEGAVVGKYKVYVNPDLFEALRELRVEGITLFSNKMFPAIVHEVSEKDILDELTLGSYLSINSKDFSDRISSGLLYQDLLWFCCDTVINFDVTSIEDVDDYLKHALKDFSKGRSNSTFFVKFAHLSTSYLEQFYNFVKLYESGSLRGQKLSARKKCNVDKKRNRKRYSKLEVPLSVLKLPLLVQKEDREKLLSSLMSKDISYSEYVTRMSRAKEILEVKHCVEKISNKSVDELREKEPYLFSDKVLDQFRGSKNSVAGKNPIYTRLVKHVTVALSSGNGINLDELVKFRGVDDINTFSLKSRMKEFKLVILGAGDENGINSLHSLKQHILDNDQAVGLIINVKDDMWMREDLSYTFTDTSVVVNTVHVQRKAPTVVDGFKKDLESLFVIGRSTSFKDKCVRTFHPESLEAAIPSLILDLLDSKENVLYVFFSDMLAFDIDPLCVLLKKEIRIEYLSTKLIVNNLSSKLGKKILKK